MKKPQAIVLLRVIQNKKKSEFNLYKVKNCFLKNYYYNFTSIWT